MYIHFLSLIQKSGDSEKNEQSHQEKTPRNNQVCITAAPLGKIPGMCKTTQNSTKIKEHSLNPVKIKTKGSDQELSLRNKSHPVYEMQLCLMLTDKLWGLKHF